MSQILVQERRKKNIVFMIVSIPPDIYIVAFLVILMISNNSKTEVMMFVYCFLVLENLRYFYEFLIKSLSLSGQLGAVYGKLTNN